MSAVLCVVIANVNAGVPRFVILVTILIKQIEAIFSTLSCRVTSIVSLTIAFSTSPRTMSSPFFPNIDPMRPVKPSFHQSTAPQNTHSQATPVQHTQNPKIVGTSVLGMKYKDGIVLAADNLGSIPISPIYLEGVTNIL
jgi:hypothetical protein